MSSPYELSDDTPVYVISVAAQLSGLHPQTLRSLRPARPGLARPRPPGRGRRYSPADIAGAARGAAALPGRGRQPGRHQADPGAGRRAGAARQLRRRAARRARAAAGSSSNPPARWRPGWPTAAPQGRDRPGRARRDRRASAGPVRQRPGSQSGPRLGRRRSHAADLTDHHERDEATHGRQADQQEPGGAVGRRPARRRGRQPAGRPAAPAAARCSRRRTAPPARCCEAVGADPAAVRQAGRGALAGLPRAQRVDGERAGDVPPRCSR